MNAVNTNYDATANLPNPIREMEPSREPGPRNPQGSGVWNRKGNLWIPGTIADQHRDLPPGVYTIGSSMTGLFLEEATEFTPPRKIYGGYGKMVDRFFETYDSRGTNTGVLLTGEKGSGKTLVSKLASIEACERGMITILVNEPYCGEQFNVFMSSITQKALVIFDEFEKVYAEEQQQQLLTLLDGVYPSNKLIIFTSNELSKIDMRMSNRPGRIFYKIKFEGLSTEFVKEFCEDNLNDHTKTESVIRAATIIGKMNFDMLKALIEEMNRYNESASEALKYLNIDAERQLHYDAVAYAPNGSKLREGEGWFNPFSSGFWWVVDEEEDVEILFEPEDIVDVSKTADSVTMVSEGYKLVLKKHEYKPAACAYDYL